MKEIILVCVLLLISAAAFIMSIRSFREKGFLFNNAYIYASRQEREKMDKKPHYKQSAVVFLLIGIIFLLNAVILFWHLKWGFYVVIAVLVFTLIYAIVSSIVIERKMKK